MNTASHGLRAVKVIAIAVNDMARAQQFYGELLQLEPVMDNGVLQGYGLGSLVFMLKDDWYGSPTSQSNPRITIECDHAPDTEAFLRARQVTIADPVTTVDEGYLVGSVLDSEGNKLWFCSTNG